MAERSAEEAIIIGRQEKAARVLARGENPFANDTKPETIQSVRTLYTFAIIKDDRYDPAKLLFHGHQHWLVDGQDRCACGEDWVDGHCAKHTPSAPGPHTIAGRIIFMRKIGGATFIKLRDRTGDLQLYCEEKILNNQYTRLEDFDLGDIIEASGLMMATIKGELSVQATTIRLLTKAYRPLPTKTGIKDVEARYRHRYVDLLSNPEVALVFKARTHIIRSVRHYLDDADFLEVETPTMQAIPGGAMAKPFVTHHHAVDMDLYMRVAPELYLKRLVVGGFERIYEIGRSYRNESMDTRHNPEFTELEYYQAYTSVSTLVEQTMDMLRTVDENLHRTLPLAHEVWVHGRTFSLDSFAVKTMKEALLAASQKAGLPDNIHELVHTEAPPIKDWAKLAKDKDRVIDWSNWRKAAQKCDSDGERLFCAYEYLVEPFLIQDYRTADGSKSIPVFITEYPVEVSPLARKIDANPYFTDRFELFIDGRELCNAFSELNDPIDQADRFKAQAAKKTGGDEEAMAYDKDYIEALEYGMPPCAGFGMGIDRLVMLFTNSQSIRDVIFFPQMRPE